MRKFSRLFFPMLILITVFAIIPTVRIAAKPTALCLEQSDLPESEEAPDALFTLAYEGDEALLVPEWSLLYRLILTTEETQELPIRIITDDTETDAVISGGSCTVRLRCMTGQIRIVSCTEETITVRSAVLWDDHQTQRYLFWGILLCGLLAGCDCLLRRRLSACTFFFAFSIAAAIAVIKPVYPYHGWDEAIHAGMVRTLCGEGVSSLSEWCRAFSLWDLGYLPSAAGYLAGQLLSLPAQFTCRMAMLTQAAAYALLCAAAVKSAPRFRATFAAAALLPTCLWQASCFSYDSMVIAASLLFCAMLLRYRCTDRKLTAGRMLLLYGPAMLFFLPKPAYGALLLLGLLIPRSAFGSKGECIRFRIFTVILVLWTLAASLLPTYSDVLGGDTRYEGADASQQIAYLLAEPLQGFGGILLWMCRSFPALYAKSAFSWYDIVNPAVFSAVLIVLLWLSSLLSGADETENSRPLGKGARCALLLIGLLPMAGLTLAQALVSTIAGSTEVVGMQPRYALPVLLPLIAACSLPERLRLKQKLLLPFPVLLMAAANIWGILAGFGHML